MASSDRAYDLIVIGSGPGGHAVAEQAAKLSARVALIEKAEIGGTCTNMGCIPTKALLLCSEYFSKISKFPALGIEIPSASFSFAKMKAHQMRSTQVTRAGIELSLARHGVEIIRGEGHLVGPQTVEVALHDGQTKQITAPHIVLAWGSKPFNIPGVEVSDRIMNSDGLLELDELPASMVIVGGGVIGVEFATFLSEVGVKIKLVNLAERILLNEEEAASHMIEQRLQEHGVEIIREARMQSATETEQGVEVQVKTKRDEFVVTAESLLMAIGRYPTLYQDELNAVGVKYTERGIMVDNAQQTSVPGIYALGDVTGGIQLAHRASHQGKALASQLFGDGTIHYEEKAVASVTYTHPPVARVGLTERQARKLEVPLDISERKYEENALAQVELAGEGFVKVIFREGGELLGATVVGTKASELIAPLSLAIAHGFTRNDFKRWIIAHPTVSEIVGETIL